MNIINIKEDAIFKGVPIVTDGVIKYIENYIRNNNVKKILEIGTAVGYSAIRMAYASPYVKITSIEIDRDKYKQAFRNISELNLCNRIELIWRDALEVEFDSKFDLIFIDGPKAQYTKLFNKFKDNLSEGGVIFSDNMKFHGFVEDFESIENRNLRALVRKLRDYIEFLKNNEEFETDFLDIGDGLAVSKKK